MNMKKSKNPMAVALGKLGGIKSARNRYKGMSKAQKSEVMSQLSRIRWDAVDKPTLQDKA